MRTPDVARLQGRSVEQSCPSLVVDMRRPRPGWAEPIQSYFGSNMTHTIASLLETVQQPSSSPNRYIALRYDSITTICDS